LTDPPQEIQLPLAGGNAIRANPNLIQNSKPKTLTIKPYSKNLASVNAITQQFSCSVAAAMDGSSSVEGKLPYAR